VKIVMTGAGSRCTSTIRRLTRNLGAPEKSFRAKRLHDIDAGGAGGREH